MSIKQRESDMLGVLLVDFSPIVREGFQAILARDERIKVTGDVPNGDVQRLTNLQPQPYLESEDEAIC